MPPIDWEATKEAAIEYSPKWVLAAEQAPMNAASFAREALGSGFEARSRHKQAIEVRAGDHWIHLCPLVVRHIGPPGEVT